MVIRDRRLPCRLDVIEDKRDELHFLMLLRRLLHRLRCSGRRLGRGLAVAEQREKVPVEYEAEHEQQKRAADSHRRTADAESAAASPPVFYVRAIRTGCPSH